MKQKQVGMISSKKISSKKYAVVVVLASAAKQKEKRGFADLDVAQRPIFSGLRSAPQQRGPLI
jgi:Mrp family chromosome partitioning ATPase